ncbi:hypothetical protein FB451DRAFT_1353741 [Mycena latifolia]|nr:hypothetical protein FB451DRAFT_1353741 [Mycena latifolia]
MRTSTTLISALALIGSALSRPLGNSSAFTPCTPCPATPWQQQAIFAKFVQDVYHNPTTASIAHAWNHIVADEIQHNPAALDGANASFAIVNSIFADPTHNISVINQAFQAPVGWVHFRIDGLNPEPTAIVDMYRFDGACIVEHWDVIQERPVNSTNPHPLF